MATGTPTKRNGGDWSDVTLQYPGRSHLDHLRRVAVHPLIRIDGESASLSDNSLIFGDNQHVLASLKHYPDVSGKVRLVYIDPPYATETDFVNRRQEHAYSDALSGPAYLEFLRTRLVLIYDIMAEGGSIYIHVDTRVASYVRLIMDEIFSPEGFRNQITRKKCNPKNYTSKQYGNVSDVIFYYVKASGETWNKPYEPWSDGRDREYRYVEPETGRRYMKVPVHAPGIRNGATGSEWRGIAPPPGKHWQYVPAKLDELDSHGQIAWSATGNPRRKVYLDESAGVAVQDIWLEYRDAHNQMVKITGYPTEKPSEMLRRIIEASSNPGDIVLDAFAGSGTTLDVANTLERRWIGIDNSPLALAAIRYRLANGLEAMGDFVMTKKHEDNQQSFLPNDRNATKYSVWALQNSLIEAVRVLDGQRSGAVCDAKVPPPPAAPR